MICIFYFQYDGCWKEAKCEPLQQKSCFGTPLPYSETSLALTNFSSQRIAIVKGF